METATPIAAMVAALRIAGLETNVGVDVVGNDEETHDVIGNTRLRFMCVRHCHS